MEETTETEALLEDKKGTGGDISAPPLRWVDDVVRRRAYHNAYYQKRKAARPPTEAKPKKKKEHTVCDWSNPVEVRALKKKYAVKEVECPACKRVVRACSITHHRRSKFHHLAVARWLEEVAAWLDEEEAKALVEDGGGLLR
jgi:hypothetical protein